MDIYSLLSRCVRNGIQFSANAGKLRVHFNGDVQDPELLPLLLPY
jgi:hypothetical protein